VGGFCDLDNVTVNGGVLVTGPFGYLKLWNGSTVSNGITVNPGGSLAVNAEFVSGLPTGTTSTVNGGINMTNPLNFDFSGGRINGPFTVNPMAANTSTEPTFCGNTVNGAVTLTDLTTGTIWFGSPEGQPFGIPGDCPGNTINGSLTATRSGALNMETNTINGTVQLNHNTADLGGNMINGSLLCDDPAFPPTVLASNTIRG